MKHRIGYACINTSISATTNKTCKLSNCTEKRLRVLIKSNLNGLVEVLKWNNDHNIYLYRISSMVIPFASHSINTIPWWNDYKTEFNEISQIIKDTKMRVSMHPGQYVNINSPDPKIVKSSIEEISWHARVLDTLELDSTHRLIIHVGGVYGNKEAAMERFIQIYKNLPEDLSRRLSLENDDKSYTIWDVLEINRQTEIPIIFDNLHHQVNNTGQEKDKDIKSILELVFATWNKETGIPKIHYSSQKPDARPGLHAESINMNEFVDFYFKYNHLVDFDIMFETKDKEKSVLKAFKELQNSAFNN